MPEFLRSQSTAPCAVSLALTFDPMVVEFALADKIPGSVAAIYNRAQYLDQRRRLMQWWGDRCDEMREETGAKVVALRPAVA